MEVRIVSVLIILPLVFIAGLIDAVAGGGGLISLPAYMIAGLPGLNAIGTNKLSSFMGTSVATATYAKKGYIQWKKAIFCVIMALVGSTIGAKIALFVGDALFKKIMLVVLPLTAFYVMKGKGMSVEKEELPLGKTIIISMVIAFVIGVYDGFYGPGTGTFLIILLTTFAHVNIKEANGLCKAINWSTNLAALTVYLTSGKTIIWLGVIAGLSNMAGNYIGTRFFDKGGVKAVKPVMLTVLVLFFIKVVSEMM